MSSAVLVTLVAMTTACGSASRGASTLETHPVRTHAGATPAPTTGAPTSRHDIDPVAPPYTPVVRHGAAPTPHIHAPQEPFTKAIHYPDHISVRILQIRQGVTRGRGPGEIPGRPLSIMRVRFDNASSKPLDLRQVVVTVSYGAPARLASPVYEAAEQDFDSTLAPKGSAVARYAFSIPTSDLGHVVMRVDFDGAHSAATFAGSIA